MTNWTSCKNLLCIRLDNMGDLLMSEPSIRALKLTFGCRITVLTSSMAAPIAKYIEAIDETIVFDAGWVKQKNTPDEKTFSDLVTGLKERNFDGAVIFSVFSQNPLPAAMVAYLAGIPRRIAYCRENPYSLLTDWIPDEEPYTMIQHQVRRDLMLVSKIGATVQDDDLKLACPPAPDLKHKVSDFGIDQQARFVIFHPSVSEEKRKFPESQWIELGRLFRSSLPHHIFITGGKDDAGLCEDIAHRIGAGASSTAGELSLPEFIQCIKRSQLLISVNTSAIHIAAALKKKMVVLYGLTNPQHSPWKGVGKVFPFSVPKDLQSRNEVLRFVNRRYFEAFVPYPPAAEIFNIAEKILTGNSAAEIPELIVPNAIATETMAI